MSAWPVLCAALALASVAAWFMGPAAAGLQWDVSSWLHRPWTLWTSAVVHLSAGHLLANLLALGALAILGAALRVGRPAALALLAAWPLGTLALTAWPQVKQYSGLSGLIHAAVAILWAHAAITRKAWPLSFVVFAGVLFKLLTEHAWKTPIAFDPAWGFNVVYAAHLSGALAGAASGLLAAAWLSRGSSGPMRS
ncbi:MAG: rhomboid family intramembrane serine protease [Comamonadaceae bacterium]|nr:MAG: rhomboid family intramembrane serine protease [Comamonadaceae bacterium]